MINKRVNDKINQIREKYFLSLDTALESWTKILLGESDKNDVCEEVNILELEKRKVEKLGFYNKAKKELVRELSAAKNLDFRKEGIEFIKGNPSFTPSYNTIRLVICEYIVEIYPKITDVQFWHDYCLLLLDDIYSRKDELEVSKTIAYALEIIDAYADDLFYAHNSLWRIYYGIKAKRINVENPELTAISFLKKVVSLHKEDKEERANAKYFLAESYEKFGDIEHALEWYRKAYLDNNCDIIGEYEIKHIKQFIENNNLEEKAKEFNIKFNLEDALTTSSFPPAHNKLHQGAEETVKRVLGPLTVKLEDASRQELIRAFRLGYKQEYDASTLCFCRAVEWELKKKIFIEYKENLSQGAKKELNRQSFFNQAACVFSQFLEDDGNKLALKQMVYICFNYC